MDILVIILLFVAFYQTRVMYIKRAVQLISLQSALLTLFCIAFAFASPGNDHSYIAGLLTFAVKVVIIPYGLLRLTEQINIKVESISNKKLNYSSIACAVFLVLSYNIVDHLLPSAVGRDIIAASLVLIFTGLIIIVTRSQAIMQIVGLITMENGIYLLGLSMTAGLPLIIELGIFLDVLIAVVVLVILTQRLRLSFKTTDTTVLRKLKG